MIQPFFTAQLENVERYATINDFPLYLILVGEYNKYLRFGRLTKWGRYKNQLKGARTYPLSGEEGVSTDLSITVTFIEPVSKYSLTLKDELNKPIEETWIVARRTPT